MTTQYSGMSPAQGGGGQVYTPNAPPAYGQSEKTVVVNQPVQPATVVVVQGQERPSATLAILFSCCVLWCCCCPLGLAAFIIAMQGNSDPDVNEAERKLSLSKKLSIAGLIIGVIFIILWNVLRVTVLATDNSHHSGGY